MRIYGFHERVTAKRLGAKLMNPMGALVGVIL